MTNYEPLATRYDNMQYRRCGRSGLMLPAISLGLWQNFGAEGSRETQRAILRRAFDLGITHFDLANNYGPPYGGAERNFGEILREDFATLRDELVISTKAGWDMWPGPYGDLAHASTCSPVWTRVCRAWASSTSTSSTTTVSIPTPARGVAGGARYGGAPGQSPLRRNFFVL